MNYRTLGPEGPEVSEIGIGAFPLSGRWQDASGHETGWHGSDDDEAVKLIHRAEEIGINLLDTAESYGDGHSEQIAGKALAGSRRDKWLIATKVSTNRGLDEDSDDLAAAATARIQDAVAGSLERLGTDYIDVYQLHALPLPGAEEAVMEALARLREDGVIGAVGVSSNDLDAIERLSEIVPIEVLQVGYNLLEEAGARLLDWSGRLGVGTLIRVPLAKGMLSGRYFGSKEVPVPEDDLRFERFNRPGSRAAFERLGELAFLADDTGRTQVQAALRFCIDHPATSCVIAGAKTVAQIEENAGAADVPAISEAELSRVREIAAGLDLPNWSAN